MKGVSPMSPVNIAERQKLDMRAGDTVRVTVRIPEKDKIRLQAFEGLVLARKHGTEAGATFTVRKVASGVGLERIFPLYSPTIEKIDVLKRTKTRRSKLYYIREKANREIRRKMRNERKAYEYKEDEKEDAPEIENMAEEEKFEKKPNIEKGETAQDNEITEPQSEKNEKEEEVKK